MKQKLWTLAFVWALLIAGLNFSHGGTNRRGTWETQGEASISTQVNHPAAPQSPMYGSWKCFPRSPVDNPHFHQQYIHSAYSGFTPLQSYFSSLTLLITSYLINQGCLQNVSSVLSCISFLLSVYLPPFILRSLIRILFHYPHIAYECCMCFLIIYLLFIHIFKLNLCFQYQYMPINIILCVNN